MILAAGLQRQSARFTRIRAADINHAGLLLRALVDTTTATLHCFDAQASPRLAAFRPDISGDCDAKVLANWQVRR